MDDRSIVLYLTRKGLPVIPTDTDLVAALGCDAMSDISVT
jgi:hypothetical protein